MFRIHSFASRAILLAAALSIALAAGTARAQSCVDERRAVVFDVDGTLTDDLVLPWTVRAGSAELLGAYQELGYAVILLTGRWNGDLRGFEGISPAHVVDFLGIPRCSTACACVLPKLGGGCLKRVCKEICVPTEKLLDLSDVTPFATPELWAWLTDLWVHLSGFPEPERTITSPQFILPAEIGPFKVETMRALQAEGFVLSHGYGDDPTDFEAYEEVGVPEAGIYATRRRLTAGDCLGSGWTACIADGFAEHTAEVVRGLPPVCARWGN